MAGFDSYPDTLPFSLEDKIVSLGAKFVKADEPYGVKVVYDGGVLTGQS